MNDETKKSMPESVLADYEIYMSEIKEYEKTVEMEIWVEKYIKTIIKQCRNNHYSSAVKTIISEYKNFTINDKGDYADIMSNLIEIVAPNPPDLVDQLQEFANKHVAIKISLEQHLKECEDKLKEICEHYDIDAKKYREAIKAQNTAKKSIQAYIDSVASSLSKMVGESLESIIFDTQIKSVPEGHGLDFIKENVPKSAPKVEETVPKTVKKDSEDDEAEPTDEDIAQWNANAANGLL